MVGEFNSPLMGVNEQILALLHKASCSLVTTPPNIELAKKCIFGVTCLLEKNEVIDPDFEWAEHLKRQKETRATQKETDPNEPIRIRKDAKELLKELGWS